MKNMLKKTFGGVCVASVLAFASAPAMAADLPVFNTSYPIPSSACATFGNLVSCSTAVLDYLTAAGYSGYTGPYSFETNQGAMKEVIVLGTNGGEILSNFDQIANGSEDAFKTIVGGQSYFYTGETDKKAVSNDPNNNGTLIGDTPYSWDISLQSLIGKLTFDGSFHEMLIGFDFSEQQSTTATLPIWALITVRDLDGGAKNIYLETQALDPSNVFKNPLDYVSNKTFDPLLGGTTPGAGDFALTIGAICVVDATVSYPSPDGKTCPDGGELVETNRAQNSLEFVNYLPGLDLLDLFDQGYDFLSVQVWMGCFNTDSDKSGPALFENGSIGPCDSAGFGDIFLLAGDPQFRVPEPGPLVLLAAGLLGLAYRRFRKN